MQVWIQWPWFVCLEGIGGMMGLFVIIESFDFAFGSIWTQKMEPWSQLAVKRLKEGCFLKSKGMFQKQQKDIVGLIISSWYDIVDWLSSLK